MEIVFLVGRVLMAALFVGSGVGHLMATDDTVAMAAKRGVGGARPLVIASGVALVVCGWMLALGIFMDVALLVLAALLMTFAVRIHCFWRLEGDEKHAEMAHFMKNVSLTGACVALFAFVAGAGAAPLSITAPLLGPL